MIPNETSGNSDDMERASANIFWKLSHLVIGANKWTLVFLHLITIATGGKDAP